MSPDSEVKVFCLHPQCDGVIFEGDARYRVFRPTCIELVGPIIGEVHRHHKDTGTYDPYNDDIRGGHRDYLMKWGDSGEWRKLRESGNMYVVGDVCTEEEARRLLS